jgi:hypothetical protein
MIRPVHLMALAAAVLGACGAPPEETASDPMEGMAGMPGMMMAHGDHSPRYGGYVFMHGDLHFEVVLTAEGEHRIYFSDAMRGELPAAVAEELRITIRRVVDAGEELEPLRPRIDEFGEAWIATGRPIDTEDTVAIVYFRFEGAPYEIEVPFIMEPPTVDPHTGLPLPVASPEPGADEP